MRIAQRGNVGVVNKEQHHMIGNTATTLDLAKCDSPADAIRVLRNAAGKFYGDAAELQSAWQDKHAGKFWERLARDLGRLANKAEGYAARP